ncbi:MBL fold metallo-hydrolase [Bacillota bacterium Meth-B3]|nr:MBL fold metallo-hydrolase [Christensenellaceae bacterium]MEA5065009.1 MBL fold metallo-hydrolase [Eubacteriales bacterium]MEA5068375.1 MBL fold metallo-hydrolase [Christensenellaceae bacterium]
MIIRWLGHSCFLITAQDGRTWLSDPFDSTVGYPVPCVSADVVTCSHKHSDHHATGALPAGFTLVDQPGVHHARGLVIEGIASFHDDQLGTVRGGNIIYVTEVDALRVAHLGDLGHQLSKSQLEKLGEVDLLLTPVGGYYTIDGEGAGQLTRALKPRVAVPMHYMTRELDAERFAGVSDERGFVEQFEHAYLDGDELKITRETIGDYPQVVVLTRG